MNNLGDYISLNCRFGVVNTGFFDGLHGADIVLKLNGQEINAKLGYLDERGLNIHFDKVELYFK